MNPAPHESPNPKPPLIPEAPETCRGIPKVGLRAGLLGHFWLGNQHLRKQNDLQETIRCGQFVRERETETETRSNNTHCTANHKTCMVNISHITHHMSYPIFYICMCIYIYMFISVYAYVYACKFVYAYVFVHACARVEARIQVRPFYVHVCIYTCIYICNNTHSQSPNMSKLDSIRAFTS